MDFKQKYKRFRQRAYIRWIRLTYPEFNGRPTKEQATAFSICKSLVSKKSAELIIDPGNSNRYIKFGNILATIKPIGEVQIVNHVYSYNIAMEGRVLHKTMNIFDQRVINDRIAIENEMNSNIVRSLSKIKKDLNR